jgi:hypothetical protein
LVFITDAFKKCIEIELASVSFQDTLLDFSKLDFIRVLFSELLFFGSKECFSSSLSDVLTESGPVFLLIGID